jgi:hypothetical protein
MNLLSAVKSIRDLDGIETKTWLNGEWITLPVQIYDFFNYLTYEMGTLMNVLEAKQYEVLACCCFAVIGHFVTHIKKKSEKVTMFYDQKSGWVETQRAVSSIFQQINNYCNFSLIGV